MTGFLPPPGGSYETCPTGTHLARCFSFVDLGTRDETYEGETKPRHSVMLEFELPAELTSQGKPHSISLWATWSMAENANLRKHLEGWRGKPFQPSDFGEGGFHVRKLLGAPAMLNVTEGKTGKPRVDSIAPVMAGVEVPKAVNAPRFVFLAGSEFQPEQFESLSEGLKRRIEQTPEFKALDYAPAPPKLGDDDTDDNQTPF